MKELSIEQKARRYDEAIERANNLHKDAVEMENNMTTKTCEIIFPELKENEDERIRKDLIIYLRSILSNKKYGDKFIEDWIAWLEKLGEQKPNPVLDIEIPFGAKDSELQEASYYIPKGFHAEIEGNRVVIKKGEQKPIDKVEPKFKVGDIIKPKDGGHEPWKIMQVDISDKKYRFKDGYVIHFSQEDNYELVEQKSTWSEEDEEMYKKIETAIDSYYAPFSRDAEEMSEWFKNLKDRVQPKQEWSKEDDETLCRCISATFDHGYLKECDWLKSFRLQSQWRPSDEQMDALHYVTNFDYGGHKATLVSLYEQLKKLREELV